MLCTLATAELQAVGNILKAFGFVYYVSRLVFHRICMCLVIIEII